jgi:lipopolysaccharide/colanic/teichoic acid biosynthesis glycosyltransferase
MIGKFDMFLKRGFDIVMSLVSLIVFSPVLVLIAVCIKMGSPGPVFYRGERVGRNGKLFRTFKFRTMILDAESRGGASTSDDDPRITQLGSKLRKYKLDELPQLIDVLRGAMSFVGPRPEVKLYVDMFTDEEKIILSVRPGITDWASLWNSDEGALLKGSSDPEKTYMGEIRPKKLRLQLKYVRERSFLNDIKIIFSTIKTVCGK